MEPTLCFAGIKAAHWEAMVPQPRQDKYRQAMWRARVWLRTNRREPIRVEIHPTRCQSCHRLIASGTLCDACRVSP